MPKKASNTLLKNHLYLQTRRFPQQKTRNNFQSLNLELSVGVEIFQKKQNFSLVTKDVHGPELAHSAITLDIPRGS